MKKKKKLKKLLKLINNILISQQSFNIEKHEK